MKLADIAGQERALRHLRALLRGRSIPPALIFHGPSGVGKRAAAVAFARALNCAQGREDACARCARCAASEKGIDPGLQILDAAYQAGLEQEETAKQRSLKIDTVRHLIADLHLRPLDGGWKVAVLDDAHTLMTQAANAMLKALEEPPPQTLWILVTHQRERLPATVRSRCAPVPFSPLPAATLARLLGERGVDEAEAARLSAAAEGSLGRALALHAGGAGDPAAWLADPLAPWKLSGALPRELHLARPAVEEQLYRMAYHLRNAQGREGLRRAGVRAALRELASFRRALAANVDPKLVLQLAALELQKACR